MGMNDKTGPGNFTDSVAEAASGRSTGSAGSRPSRSRGSAGSRRSAGSAAARGSAGSRDRDLEARADGTRSAESKLCVFRVGGQSYALSAALVAELIEVTHITPVPLVPAAVLGIFNLRGEPLPLVDLGPVLGLASAQPASRMPVIVIRYGPLALGGRVESMDSVVPRQELRNASDATPLILGFLANSGTNGPIAVLDPSEFVARLSRLKA